MFFITLGMTLFLETKQKPRIYRIVPVFNNVVIELRNVSLLNTLAGVR